MYDVTAEFNKAAFSDDRQVTLKAAFGGTEYKEELMSLTFTETMSSDSTIGIGETCSNTIELKMRNNEAISFSGQTVEPYLSFDGTEFCPLGRFYVSEVTTEDEYKSVKLKAYDQMAYLTDTYAGTATTCEAAVAYIAGRNSFEVEATEYPEGDLLTGIECTEREMLGYIAGLLGANARFNRNGKLEFTFYEATEYGDVTEDHEINADDVTYINNNLLGTASRVEAEAILGRLIVGKAFIAAQIKDAVKSVLADVNFDGIVDEKDTAEIQAYIDGTPYESTSVGQSIQELTEDVIYNDGLTLSGCKEYTITCLVSGSEDNAITSGSGRAITFTNPFMTQEILDGLAAKRLPFSYYAGSVRYRGNPAYECGDILNVKGMRLPVMQQELEFDGGLEGKVESYGLSDETIKLEATPSLTKTLDRKVNAVQKTVEEINNTLLSGEAGYMVLDEETIDGVKRLSGFKLINTPTVSGITKGWVANKDGIGWSEDGFKTISKVGISMSDGKIYADTIAANSIITNSFQVGADGQGMTFDGTTGKITFGSNVSMSWNDLTDTPDIPTSTSDLTNDSGFINSATATTITNNAISTASISANQITTGTLDADRIGAGSFTITGGTINIDTGSDNTSVIKLNHGNNHLILSDWAMVLESGGLHTTIFPDGIRFESDGSGETSTITNSDLTIPKIIADSVQIGNFYAATTNDLAKYYSSGSDINVGQIKSSETYSDTVSYNTNMYIGTTGILHRTTTTSSREVKHDIEPISDASVNPELLYNAEIVQFRYNEDILPTTDPRYNMLLAGFIVEDLINVYPTAVDVDENGKAFQWNGQYLIPPMLALIQKQHKEIEELKAKVEAMQ